MPSTSQLDYSAVAKLEEAIGRSEQAITRQLWLIEAVTERGQDAHRARELVRVAEEHLAELYLRRQQLLGASAA